MAVSLALLPGEFVLSGGHLKKSMIGTGLTTVGAKQFVLLKKGEHWLSWFTTGSGVQQSSLNGSEVCNTIREQVRAQILKAIAAAKGAAAAPAITDLTDELELCTVGIKPATLKAGRRNGFTIINSRSVKFIPSVITVPLVVAGAAEDWVATFVVEATASVRIELTTENLENILKAVGAEAATLAAVAERKVARAKGKALPKKERELPAPWGSPNHRRYTFKDRGEVSLTKGVKDTTQFRTPRKYSSTTKKRRASGTLTLLEKLRKRAAAGSHSEPLEEVFFDDGEMTDFDVE